MTHRFHSHAIFSLLFLIAGYAPRTTWGAADAPSTTCTNQIASHLDSPISGGSIVITPYSKETNIKTYIYITMG
jgi:hypothetical protein